MNIKMKIIFPVFLLLLSLTFFNCKEATKKDALPGKENKWESIFNGKDLTGWNVKIAGYPLNENYLNTFRVEDGLLVASYADYDTFSNQFGHIFYEKPYSKYRMKLQYRFTGDQVKGGPGWAYKNNGIMFHCQAPETMLLDQGFPVSLEFQMLGGNGKGPRSTGCLCTPGLNVIIADTLETRHCLPNSGKTIEEDRWVDAELYVDGSRIMHHIIEGDTVMTYSKPQVGGGSIPEGYPLPVGTIVSSGYIALQAESHTTQFRNIMVQDLSDQ